MSLQMLQGMKFSVGPAGRDLAPQGRGQSHVRSPLALWIWDRQSLTTLLLIEKKKVTPSEWESGFKSYSKGQSSGKARVETPKNQRPSLSPVT